VVTPQGHVQNYRNPHLGTLPTQLAIPSVTSPVVHSVASTVVQPIFIENSAPPSITTSLLSPSQTTIHVFSAHTNPLAHDMTQQLHVLDTI
ncbi:Hypothetical predicted protein, partial [Olea europaea subsp. europaea]